MGGFCHPFFCEPQLGEFFILFTIRCLVVCLKIKVQIFLKFFEKVSILVVSHKIKPL